MLDQIKGQNGKILIAGLAGVTAGIIAGLLMAPEAGQNTRQSIAKRAIDFGGLLSKTLKMYSGKEEKPKAKKGKKKKKRTEGEA